MKENSIEEDIKLLEELDWLYLDKPEIICDRYEEATNHILSDYKRVLQENEKLKAKLLDTLEGQKIIKEETPQYIKENYILKEKVKDKIEKYKNMCISNVNGCENYFKDNYNELVFRRMEQLEKELLGKFIDESNER